MLKWIKRLLSRPKEVSTRVMYWDNAGTRQYGEAVGVRGLHLVLDTDDGPRLIESVQTADREQFKALWRRFGGQTLYDQDGDEIDPF